MNVFLISTTLFLFGGELKAGSLVRARAERLNTLVRVELLKNYPGTRIEILGEIKVRQGEAPQNPSEATFLGDNGRGEAILQLREVSDASVKSCEIQAAFAAWKRVPIAQKRVRPGERLSADGFALQEINFAISPNKEVRGLALPGETELSGLEAGQTILEGQFPLASAVRKTPDVLRGESLKVRILSGNLTLSTQGNAEEPGTVGNMIRVISGKTKRQLVGKLMSDHSVEVSL